MLNARYASQGKLFPATGLVPKGAYFLKLSIHIFGVYNVRRVLKDFANSTFTKLALAAVASFGAAANANA
ncbi:MAG: hypothetical protein K8R50_08050 [Betaproteobacteria bacterium]|nr:hypothetical protein [Betaproteobacteria bacterium]